MEDLHLNSSAGSHSHRLETHEYGEMEMYHSCNSSENHPLEERIPILRLIGYQGPEL